jgi:hypothetical protein
MSRLPLEPTWPYIQWEPGALPPEVKWSRPEADLLPPSSMKVKNGGSIPPLPHMPSWLNLLKHRDNFMFTFTIYISRVLIAMVMKSSLFRDIIPCSLPTVNCCFGGTCHLHLYGQRISLCFPPEFMLVFRFFSSTLKMVVTSSSKMSVDFLRTTGALYPPRR